MCIGIPMRVIETRGGFALCEADGERASIDMALVGEQPPGAWVLTHLGVARDVLTDAAAEQIRRALQALPRALAGDQAAIEAAFADLIDREPQLPEHLRPEKMGSGPFSPRRQAADARSENGPDPIFPPK